MRLRSTLVLTLGFTAISLFGAAQASAAFHLMKIREVHVDGDRQFVELQMYANGQNRVGGHSVTLYGPDGTAQSEIELFEDVASGDTQRTILIASPAAETGFGVEADFDTLIPGVLDPAGGAVCFESIDCVAWGTWSGTPQSAVGTPAPALSGGMSLTRSIEPGCETLLEAGDDSGDSATDFELVTPSPRNNATAPSETDCTDPEPEPGPDPEPEPEPNVVTDPDATADKQQRQKGRKVKVKVSASAQEAVTVTGSGKVKVGKRSYGLGVQTKQLDAGQRKVLRLKPERKKDEKKIRKAIKKGKKVRAVIRVDFEDAEGATATEKRVVRLK